MNKLEQAARQALEALEVYEIKLNSRLCNEALTALREALAEQAEKEPFKMICPRCKVDRVTTQCPNRGGIGDCPMTATAQSAAPVKQTEQESVGYFAYDEEHDIWEELTGPNAPGATPLYTAPVRTKDLTDDEIMKINVDTASIVPTCDRQFHFARAIIAKFKEKNK